jgi:arsenate reductase
MSSPKKILFICIGNTCRSQMAEGFARARGDGMIEVRSAGTTALGEVNGTSTEAMAEVGVDISGQTSDQLNGEMIDWADYVITLGCCTADELCPVSYTGTKRDWPIDDPYGASLDFMRTVRDEIGGRVDALIKEVAGG